MANIETAFKRRQRRIRHNLKLKANGKVRLSIFRSNKHIHAQIIDDAKGVTIVAASTVDKDLAGKIKGTSNIEAAKKVGELIAKRAKANNVVEVVFDRSGFLYHGRVKALADAAREAGLKF
jgi:large subunit ribosomal protein L18